MEQIALKNTKPGELIRRKPDSKVTFVRGAYDRAEKKYELQDWDDFCRFVYLKGSTIVWIGFNF